MASLNFNTGRFAPSPSGPLHFGSLIAALGSFLIAKTSNAKWLLRIEDIDPPREVAGASDMIMRQLEAHGLYWDDSVLYQSQRLDFYEHTLEQLYQQDLIYPCSCTRKQIKQANQTRLAHSQSSLQLYPNTCQGKGLAMAEQLALRLRHGDDSYHFVDLLQGECRFDDELYAEDFTVKRKDGLIAYQLAVVLDDIEQGIDHVVRGCDLLDSTPRQLRLYQILGATDPKFVHLPLIINDDGNKLSKQNHAPSLEAKYASQALTQALSFLGQLDLSSPLAQELNQSSPEQVIDWALEQFDFEKIPKIQQIKQ